jgi:hypothetical protein
MPILFARVELRGEPDEEDYENLHALLRNKHWFQHLPGHPDMPMPMQCIRPRSQPRNSTSPPSQKHSKVLSNTMSGTKLSFS